MMVANSFDIWQKDTFFSAAEEVQESADIMESAYRTWVREKREGLTPEDLHELCRELQTALGTAKWQLEEFERAVRLSYGNRSDDNTTSRHRQFVVAIENQISRVETALRESFNESGKQPLRWVNLDEEERDDLAMFLSGTSGTLQSAKDEFVEVGPSKKSSLRENQCTRRDEDININIACNRDSPDQVKGFKDVVTINKDAKYVIELEAKEIPGTSNDINCQADRTTGTRRTWNSPSLGAWKIVIADEDEQRKTLMSSIEATPKEKEPKPIFWKQRCGDHPQAKGGISNYIHLRGINRMNQLFGRVGGFQRQLQSPLQLQCSCSIQLTLALMLTVFLMVPFVIYSA